MQAWCEDAMRDACRAGDVAYAVAVHRVHGLVWLAVIHALQRELEASKVREIAERRERERLTEALREATVFSDFRPAKVKGHDIAREIARQHGVRLRELVSDRRDRHLVTARQHAMWRMKYECHHLSLPAIGRILGNRDHTTVLHGIRKHQQRIDRGEV